MSQPDIPLENKCSRCLQGTCCTYITEALGTMRSKAEFEHLLWQVAHENIEAYKDKDGWFLLIRGKCEHLGPSGGCNIYDDRPQICRDYDNDWCEFDEPAESHFTYYFRNYSELLSYCQQRFKRWGQ